MFIAAGLIGILAGAATIFGDLIVWGIVALVYAASGFYGLRRARQRVPTEPSLPTALDSERAFRVKHANRFFVRWAA